MHICTECQPSIRYIVHSVSLAITVAMTVPEYLNYAVNFLCVFHVFRIWTENCEQFSNFCHSIVFKWFKVQIPHSLVKVCCILKFQRAFSKRLDKDSMIFVKNERLRALRVGMDIGICWNEIRTESNQRRSSRKVAIKGYPQMEWNSKITTAFRFVR